MWWNPYDRELDFGEPIVRLGAGSFGEVFLAKDRTTGTPYAIKRCDDTRVIATQTSRCLYDEIFIHSRLKHPNVLSLYGYFMRDGSTYLMLEYAPGGDLLDKINTSGPFSEDQSKEYIKPIIRAVSYIHKVRVTHRDLKPENILFGMDGRLKIADFGLAISSQSRREPELAGTYGYIPPDALCGYQDLSSNDCYAIGVILFRLLYKINPFSGLTDWSAIMQRQNRLQFEYPRNRPIISEDAEDFMFGLLMPNRAERTTLRGASMHKWLE